jgi:hypothetical protein
MNALTRNTWTAMVYRCTSPNSSSYHKYGGRGIAVCERWLTYENFVNDMGERPGKEYTIDRIDNEKGYFPGNCKWSTAKEQATNRRQRKDARLITYNGEEKPLKQWAEEFGLEYYTLDARIKRGWSVERALTEPRYIKRK